MTRATSELRIFVYGSLKRGFSNHAQLAQATFVGECQTAPRYRLLVFGAYPALSEGDREVAGELYAVDQRALFDLDRFEGKAYRRASVELADGSTAQAFFLVPELVARALPAPENRWL
jgi:gamma-glutamylcyclotransferase (GGCT)/AIG2-like uncharacterized protein YtfP